jgi:hypothetical protein
MKRAIHATSRPKSNNCSLTCSKSNAILLPNSGYKIESNNRDDEGSKLILIERNIATIFLPHEVVVLIKLLSHAHVAKKDLSPTTTGLGKEIVELEHKAKLWLTTSKTRC